MDNVVATLMVAGFGGLLVGVATHPILGVIAAVVIAVLYFRHVAGAGMPAPSTEDIVFLWEYRPGQFVEASAATSGGGGAFFRLSDPDGPYTDMYDSDGAYVGRLRRTGPGEWTSQS